MIGYVVSRWSRWALVVVLSSALHLGLGAAAPAIADDARQLIEELAQDTVAVLQATTPESPERALQLEPILEKGFDLPYLAQLAVGRPWREMSASEREAFIDVFSQWVVQTQSVRLGRYAGESFEVTGTSEASGSDSMITSQISGGALAQPVRVDWRVREENGDFSIIDVVIEGVSMVVTYRNEFQPIVQRGGVEGLIAELRTRTRAAAG
jgi:phospholipid transport system substrate-binding protein